ncbi:MAG: S49 family peptidase [Chlamydiales bacterium]|nr:S49 family peptidase [Chlamydiales bacterium]
MKQNKKVKYTMQSLSHLWYMNPTAFSALSELAENQSATLEKLALQMSSSEEEAGEPIYTIREDGIAIVRIRGPLFRYSTCLSMMLGGTSYEEIGSALETLVLKKPEVKGILAEFDTPGGEANGCDELSRLIFSLRGKKPMVAYCGGQVCSAGYYLFSPFPKLVISRTADVGSIGVVCSYVDKRKQREMNGEQLIEIVSDVSPNKRFDLLTEEGQGIIKENINKHAKIFLDAISSYRTVAPEIVARDFGQGGILVGEEAVGARMADSIGNFEDALNMLSLGESQTNLARNLTNHLSLEGAKMGKKVTTLSVLKKAEEGDPPKEKPAIIKCPHCNEDIEVVPVVEEISDPKPDDGNSIEEGEKKENSRVTEIMSLYKPEYSDLVMSALKDRKQTKASVSEAILDKMHKGELFLNRQKDALELHKVGSDPGAIGGETREASRSYVRGLLGKEK